MSATIEVRNIGPVEHISIPVPDSGGVVVLKGRNGRGKSNTLEAVESLATGKGTLSVRDGALRGEVEGWGAKITVGRSTRRTGELEVYTLEGKLSIADLVDPGLKSDEAADAKRIRALVSLTGKTPNPAAFHELIGGCDAFNEIVSASSLEGDDWVVMADRIKRDIEKEARKEESQAEYAEGRALGMVDADEPIPEVAVDPDSLQKQLVEAVSNHSRLVAMRASAEEAVQRRSAAIETIAETSSDIMEKCQILFEAEKSAWARMERAKELLSEIDLQIATLKAKREESAIALQSAAAEHLIAKERFDVAEEEREGLESLRAIVDKPIETVDPEEVEKASHRVSRLKSMIEQAAIDRERVRRIQEAREVRRKAVEHRKRAEELRNAAKNTDEVLSALVSKTCQLLRVEHGRLVLTTHRGATYYSELSHGERWKIAIDIAIDQLGDCGVIVVPQEAWEGCDSVTRSAIVEHAHDRGVVILTAECSDDETIVAAVA